MGARPDCSSGLSRFPSRFDCSLRKSVASFSSLCYDISHNAGLSSLISKIAGESQIIADLRIRRGRHFGDGRPGGGAEELQA